MGPQDWGLPAVKGLYSAIYRGRDQGGLGWETLAQGTAPWGQTEKPLVTFVASLCEQMEARMSARTGFWNGRHRVRNNKVRTTVLSASPTL